MRSTKPITPPGEALRRIKIFLRYDKNSGDLIWNARGIDYFPSRNAFSVWNSKNADKVAGYLHSTGYIYVTVEHRLYKVHRIIWFLTEGEWPGNDFEIDHINGVRNDNRRCNLRIVSNGENKKNLKRRNDNSSGVTGVAWDRGRGKWVARITSNKKDHHIGRFSVFDDAVKARKDAELRFGFHENHGRA